MNNHDQERQPPVPPVVPNTMASSETTVSKYTTDTQSDPTTPTSAFARALALIKTISQFRKPVELPDDTTELPLIPMREDPEGCTKAIEDDHYDRSIPYHLRGRRDEFNFLARRLIQEPSPITLVTGPPGTGKTTLLNTVAAYARRIGHTVVRIRPQELANASAIAQKCRKAVMSPKDAAAHITRRESITLEAETQATVDIVFAQLGTKLGGDFGQEITREEIGDIDLVEHLQATCAYRGRNRPLLLIVDEVQDIRDTLAKGAEARESIKANLKILNDAILEDDTQLPITTVLAGLDPIRDTIRTLVSRPATGSDLQLAPIATEHIRDILQDYLDISIPRPIPERFYTPQQLQNWAETCQGHVMFANQVGYLIQDFALNQLAQGVPRARQDKEIPKLQRILDDSRDQYYVEQLPDDGEDPRAFDVVLHIVEASLQNHSHGENAAPTRPDITPYPLTRNVAVKLAQRALLTDPEWNEKPHARDLREIMQRLQRSGIIRYMRPVRHFLHLDRNRVPAPVAHCDIPIPTITEYVHRQYQQLDEPDRDRIDRNVRNVMRKHSVRLGTRWHWHRTCARKPIPKIDVPYEPPHPQDREPNEETVPETDLKP